MCQHLHRVLGRSGPATDSRYQPYFEINLDFDSDQFKVFEELEISKYGDSAFIFSEKVSKNEKETVV